MLTTRSSIPKIFNIKRYSSSRSINKNLHTLIYDTWLSQNTFTPNIIKFNPFHIQFVPYDALTQELCDYAFHQNPDVFPIIPHRFKTSYMWISTLKTCVSVDDLPANALSHELFVIILRDYYVSTDVKRLCIRRRIIDQGLEISRSLDIQSVAAYVKYDELFRDIPLNIFQQLDIDVFNGLVMTGFQFNKYFSHLHIIDMSNRNEYYSGLNVYRKEFDPCHYGVGGRFVHDYKCNNHDKRQFRDAKIPNIALVRMEFDKIKTNMVILGPNRHMHT